MKRRLLLLALFLAHTFLAYFVGWDTVVHWVFGSPKNHPVGFAIVTMTTAAMLLDFAYFREQVCMVACPYGRWQSALLDSDSLIVAYDYNRGEPRGKGKDRTGKGDCVDCLACVTTCPTGIDIRNGLQMECIHCTQCMDACDEIMEKVYDFYAKVIEPGGRITNEALRGAVEEQSQANPKIREMPLTTFYDDRFVR